MKGEMANVCFEAFIAMPPHQKDRARTDFANRRTYTPNATKQAEARIAQEVHVQWRKPLLLGPVALVITVWMLKPASKPKRKPSWPTGKPDWDNLGKLVCDALNGVIWHDDAQVVSGTLHKRYCNADHPAHGYQILVAEVVEVAP